MSCGYASSTLALIVVGLALGGCAPTGSTPGPTGQTNSPPPKVEESLPEGLAKLTPQDRAEAVSQKICPVSGEPLGSMGAPMRISVKDKAVWICCESCEEPLKKNPDKYLAKLK